MSPRRSRMLACLLSLAALAACAVVGAAWVNRPTTLPYVAQIRFARWETPRRLTIRFGLIRTGGRVLYGGRAPDIQVVTPDGKPLPLVRKQTAYHGCSPDNRARLIETTGTLAPSNTPPESVRLRVVIYRRPAWRERLLLHLLQQKIAADDEPTPAFLLPGSEVAPRPVSQNALFARKVGKGS